MSGERESTTLDPPNPSEGSSSSRPEPARAESSKSLGSTHKQQQHAPTHPSGLRHSHLPEQSPVGSRTDDSLGDASIDTALDHPDVAADGIHPSPHDISAATSSTDAGAPVYGHFEGPNFRSRVLNDTNWDAASGCGSENCGHGVFSPRASSPRPPSIRSYGSFGSDESADGFGGRYPGAGGESSDATRRLLGDVVTDELLGGGRKVKTSTTKYLAKKYGVKNRRIMYLAYYVPFLNWVTQYEWRFLKGDIVGALTVASFYIPMALSYASNLGHVPPIHGLYSFVFNPLVYAVLGTCPRMLVGPEATGSLLTGQVVRSNIDAGTAGDKIGMEQARIAGVVTTTAGAVILTAGLFRLGFLDNVLSRPFLRGFISAVGAIIFIDQLIPELGLSDLAGQVGGVEHGSCAAKVLFLVRNVDKAHGLTAAVSLGAFVIIMVCREIKRRLQPRYPNVAYVPDRFLIVVLSTVLAWQLRWDEHGIEVLGDIKTHGPPFQIQLPTQMPTLKDAGDAFSTSFVIALLGFFESSVAAKSLSVLDAKGDGMRNVNVSTNRELVALGVANLVGGLFMAMPAFGGYGKSKVNASTGGKTPVSLIILSMTTLTCILFLLPYFYYLPKGVLSAMISVVACSLLEEAPHDIRFFIRIHGWSELSLMCLIFLATVFWNVKLGITVGIGVSLLRVLKHSTRPRIQILGRVPGTTDRFENAEIAPGRLENVEGALIVKIPEPLTFANTGDLKNRLRRLEAHGTGFAHPALPRIRKEEHNRNIIFDVHGVTGLDGAGAQVLAEIVEEYVRRGVRVFFCRVPSERSAVWKLFVRSGIIELCGGRDHFVISVEEALRMSDMEEELALSESGMARRRERYQDVVEDGGNDD